MPTVALAMALVLLLAAVAQGLDIEIAPYREAAQAGAVGAVMGRAYEERRTPTGADRPLIGTTVTLVPRSGTLLRTFERLKQQARDSADSFRAAAPALRRAREAYERRLWEAGAPELVKTALVDAEGGFRVAEVPAGAWLLVATHAVSVDVSTPHTTRRERQMYKLGPRVVGHQAVKMWVREIAVDRAGTESVNLTDRNAWFTGVAEEKALDAGR